MDGLQAELNFRNSATTENGFKFMKSSTNWLLKEGFLDYDLTKEDRINDEFGKEIL